MADPKGATTAPAESATVYYDPYDVRITADP